jgi:putative glutamine amidotransferase
VTRPAIGITIGYDDRRQGQHSLRRDYVRSVEKGGGLPLILAPGGPGDAPELLGRLDGLVLSGGSDVDPALYGEEPHPRVGRVIRERDDFELALCRQALARDLPLLAICRGHQVLNVATGGTLIQDIPSEVVRGGVHDHRRERWEKAHEVEILPGTRLREILGAERVSVNSFHHQAVARLGRGLRVSARSVGDDLIEGIEAPEQLFAVGVQWHPESFWNRPGNFDALFAALVEAAARRGRAAAAEREQA